MSGNSLSEQVNEITWHHTIDLGDGLVTHGLSGRMIPPEFFPDVSGRTVLDIGAWDGWYSFLAERQGASRVVALDHYVWCVDLKARTEYWDECRAKGILPDVSRDEGDFWRDDMPGRRGFDLAREALHSQVEPMVADFMTMDLEQLGTFDVVLYLGVLYHMREPLTALERVRRTTAQVAMIETEAVWIPGAEEDASLFAFYPGDELGRDYGNWFAPNEQALHGLCRAAGFSKVETRQGPPTLPPAPAKRWLRRLVTPPPAATQNYRLVVHAYP